MADLASYPMMVGLQVLSYTQGLTTGSDLPSGAGGRPLGCPGAKGARRRCPFQIPGARCVYNRVLGDLGDHVGLPLVRPVLVHLTPADLTRCHDRVPPELGHGDVSFWHAT